MGKSAKFYKKPTLKEKQSGAGGSRSTVSSSPYAALASSPSAKVRSSALSESKKASSDAAVKRAAELNAKSAHKRALKAKERQDVEDANKPQFRPAHQAKSQVDQDDQGMEEDDGAEKLKRRPRRRQRRDFGPMPKDLGIDYLRQWDSRAK